MLLFPKWKYTVWTATPARAAIWSSVVVLYPAETKSSVAASVILRRVTRERLLCGLTGSAISWSLTLELNYNIKGDP